MSVTLESLGENGPAFIDSAVLRSRVAVVARPRFRAAGSPTEDGENADTAASDAHIPNTHCTMLAEHFGGSGDPFCTLFKRRIAFQRKAHQSDALSNRAKS
jgi:hypothetical protein